MARRDLPHLLYLIAIVLVVLWLLGIVLQVAGGIVHVLLVIALILVIYRLTTGKRVL